MNFNEKILLSLFIIFVILATAYLVGPSSQADLNQLISLAPPIIAAIAGIYLVRAFGLGSENGKVMFLIATGILFWALGEIGWFVYKNVLLVDPFPSLVDVIYLIGYIFLFLGLRQAFKLAAVSWQEIAKTAGKAAGFYVLSAICLIALVLYFGIYRAYDPSESLLFNLVSIGYGIADLLLFFFASGAYLVTRVYQGGRLGSFWSILATGFFITLAADILFAIFEAQYVSDLKPFTYLDLLWAAGYLVIAYAFIINHQMIMAIKNKLSGKQ